MARDVTENAVSRKFAPWRAHLYGAMLATWLSACNLIFHEQKGNIRCRVHKEGKNLSLRPDLYAPVESVSSGKPQN